MSIQKITQTDIDTNGVKSLPSRPSAPTLYSGKALTAGELKEAFDRLPTLIAERFNALLESTGLFDAETPADTLAELIATGIAPAHSLKTFFEDVKNGNLALYLTAGTGKSLAEVLNDLATGISQIQEAFSVSVTGEGDVLTDAEMRGTHLTLHRGISSEAILKDAKAYADARVSNLENAAKDILFTYPTETMLESYHQVSEDTLENAALLSLGAVPPLRENYLPEPILSTYRGSSLTVAWDAQKGELVLNGTLRAADSPVRLAPFEASIPHKYIMLTSFYRSGTVSTQKAKFSVITDSGSAISVPLTQADALEYAPPNSNLFSHLELSTTADTVFEDYRFNLLLAKEHYSRIEHIPYCSRFDFKLPKMLVSQTANLWDKGPISGDGYVSFSIPTAPKNAQYMFGVLARPSAPSSRPYCLLEVYAGDEVIFSNKLMATRFSYCTFDPTSPITEVRVYAAETPAKSVGQSVALDKIYLGFIDYWDTVDTLNYTESVRNEVVFPESLSRFAPLFVGIDEQKCNYFNLEIGVFFENTALLTLDGSLNFEKDTSETGRFSAPFATPADLISKNLYLPSALFGAPSGGVYDECVWFTEDRVFVQSELFAGLSAAEVKQFFAFFPIEVVYALASITRHSLLTDEASLWEPPILRVAPLSYVYFSNDGDDTQRVFAKIQYQIKET